MSADIIEQAKAALVNESATSADLASARKALALRRAEVNARTEAISSNAPNGIPAGPERRKMAEAGDMEALAEMSQEEVALKAEADVIATLDARLQGRITQVRADEAIRDLPALHAELAEAVAREEAATKALETARAATEQLVAKGHELRMHIRAVTGMESMAPTADMGLVRQYIAARGYTHHPTNGYGQDIHKIVRFAEAVGQGPEHRREDHLAA
ncbi:MAG TPA: hypothetical protein VNQ97_13325 [Burkholderiaceae bacterium]|nr:hypothetical protein [Burkholderiaceae bacterium]